MKAKVIQGHLAVYAEYRYRIHAGVATVTESGPCSLCFQVWEGAVRLRAVRRGHFARLLFHVRQYSEQWSCY